MIRVLIADDHPIVREGFGAIVNAEADIQVVAQASNGVEALEQAAEANPDVALMDLRMPEMGGAEAIRRLRQANPDLRAIVLTTYDDDEAIYEAIRAGARGYLLKDVRPKDLVRAIRRVHAGGSLLQPVVVERLLDRLGPEDADDTVPVEALTPRELEVLQIMARGARNRDIAQELVISERTVKIHVANVIAKLGVTNRTAAVVRAIDLNLIAHRDS
ncbi:MAG: response regulator transcription factor [Chloroflexota bacterium]|nr:response regulator transcription factor [Chloroflexota bacterium]MDE2902864.1 response regulator transcription factor [Chloroflexota bacterium]MDE2919469.1 response regulator transcription factor [Chloroflexota bacterium]